MLLPSRLVLRQRSGYRIAIFTFVLILLTASTALLLGFFTGGDPDELALPALALGGMALSFALLFAGITAINAMLERRQIDRTFRNDLWALWQYSAQQWSQIANALHQREKGMFKPGYNLVVGVIFGGILAAVAVFVPPPFPQFPAVVLGVAVFVFLLYSTTGLLLPLQQRRARNARHRQRMKIAAPRVWFAEGGFYHEVGGFQSLRQLLGVRYDAPSRHLEFTVRDRVSTGEYTRSIVVTVAVPVPDGSEQEAQHLAQRYSATYGVGERVSPLRSTVA